VVWGTQLGWFRTPPVGGAGVGGGEEGLKTIKAYVPEAHERFNEGKKKNGKALKGKMCWPGVQNPVLGDCETFGGGREAVNNPRGETGVRKPKRFSSFLEGWNRIAL